MHTAKVEITVLETRLKEIQSSGAPGVVISAYILDKIAKDLLYLYQIEKRLISTLKGNKSANVLAI